MPLIRPQRAVPVNDGRVPGRLPGLADVPAANLEPSLPGALGPQNGQFIRLPGVNFPPAGATPVDEIGDGNIAAGTSASLITIAVPFGWRFRMEGIGFTADDETALAFLQWSILAPDPISGYINKSSAVGSVRNLTPIFFLASNVDVVIRGTALAAAVVTYHFVARVRGWFYSEQEAS